MSNVNRNLHKARNVKNDEFYTRLEDIENELQHYKQHFHNKIVLCNCDNPLQSAFWEYFRTNFAELGLKKLISTYYNNGNVAYKTECVDGDRNIVTVLCGDGDFRSQECIELLKEADIVVTNPPFSLFREFVATLMQYEKKFLIIGSKNAITYKEFFPLLKDNKVWLGCNAVKAFRQPDGTVKKFGNIGWYTNLDVAKRNDELVLTQPYSSDKYPRYDNYDAINVDKVADIPYDYCESWEITVEEYDKLPKGEWEIVRHSSDNGFETVFVLPAKGTALRKAMCEQSVGYKEAIENALIASLSPYFCCDEEEA